MRRSREPPRTATAAVIAASLFLLPRAAHADVDDEPAIPIAFGTISAIVGVPGIVVFAGNTYYLSDGRRPNSGWRISGFVLGGINVALGVVFAATSPQGFGKIYAPQLGFGIANLVIGTADVIVSAVGTARTAKVDTSWTLVPLAVADTRGRLSPGVGIRVGAF